MGNICSNNNDINRDIDTRVPQINKRNLNILDNEDKKDNRFHCKSNEIVSNYSKAKSVRVKKIESEYLIKNEYNKRVFDLINKIRTDPPEYSKTVLDNIKNIIYETHLVKNEETGDEEDKKLCLFKKIVKVNLNKGEPCFQEVANILKNTPSMDKFIFKDKLVFPLPKTEEEIVNPKHIKNMANKIMNKTELDGYFKEYIKNPEVAVLMMIVDDTKNMSGVRRNYLLNPEFKFIGIDSKFIEKKFVAYFSFSK